MKQAIAGVSPPGQGEMTIMTVWPTLGARWEGRMFGRFYLLKPGVTLCGVPVTVGRLIALLSIPLILPLYFLMLLPCFIFLPKMGPVPRIYVSNPLCRRYRLTNRRVVIEHGTSGTVFGEVSLDQFDAIEVEVLPGQQWYPCGELIFFNGKVETFRLSGVSRPETFRQTCLKAQRSHSGVRRALDREPVGA
jgi:hypothetical protein